MGLEGRKAKARHQNTEIRTTVTIQSVQVVHVPDEGALAFAVCTDGKCIEVFWVGDLELLPESDN